MAPLLIVGGGATGILTSTGSIWGVYAASTRSIYGFHTLNTLSTPSILDVCTVGTVCTRGSVLVILPVLQVFGPSVMLILPALAVFRPQYYNALSTAPKCTRYSEYARSMKQTGSICAILLYVSTCHFNAA